MLFYNAATFDRTVPHIADSEDAGLTGLQQIRIALQLPARRQLAVGL